jgi:hypothetical protein
VRFKIHPAIGIARVGNSEDYYLAPETAGGLPLLPEGGKFQASDFRDGGGKLRRQAVRFQVFDYGVNGDSPTPVEARDGVDSIRWTVHVANKKALWYRAMVNAGENGYAPDHPLRNPEVKDRLSLIIDPGPRTLNGADDHKQFDRDGNGYRTTFPGKLLSPPGPSIDSLGDAWIDSENRLIFAGGYGISGSPAPGARPDDYANNENWWDDTSDGPVTATVVMKNGDVKDASPAWVTVAPPRYAPELLSVVTLYDAIFDISVRLMRYRPEIFSDGMWTPDYMPSWEDEIRPILERAHLHHWVVAVPPAPHDFDWERLGDPDPAFNAFRRYYLDQVRPPDETNRFFSLTNGLPLMPYLCGDNCIAPAFTTSNYLTLTRTQYHFLMLWADGKFTRGCPRKLSYPDQLDKAALENCSGGPFSPGIEMGWICRNPRIYQEAFRIRLKSPQPDAPLSVGNDMHAGLEPGDLSKYQALPWQADFNGCSFQLMPVEGRGKRVLWWWPVQRPTYVHVKDGKQAAWVGTSADQNADDYVQFKTNYDMLKKWCRLGFIFNHGTPEMPRFQEVKRTLRKRP